MKDKILKRASWGKDLACLRRKEGMTQAQFAEKIGCSVVSVADWETEKKTPRSYTFKKLQKIFPDLPCPKWRNVDRADGFVSLWIDAETKSWLRLESNKSGISRSELIRRIIREVMEND